MEELIVNIEESDSKGRAFVNLPSKEKAEMTYSKAGSNLIIIDHTEVSEEWKGKGLGRKLLDTIVAMAREKGIKILPLCPFAKSVFDKDASIRNVLM